MSPFCCCFGRRTPGRRSTGRSHEAGSKTKEGELQSPLSCNSFISEYYDAEEHFSVSDASSPTCSTAPRHSVFQEKSLEAHGHGAHHHQACGVDASISLDGTSASARAGAAGTASTSATAGETISVPLDSARGFSGHLVGSSEASEEPLQAAGGPIAKLASCLSILDNIRMPGAATFGSMPFVAGMGAAGGPCGGGAGEQHAGASSGAVPEEGGAGAGQGGTGGRPTARKLGGKLEPGCTLRRRDMSESVLEVREAYEECHGDGPSSSGRPFMIRSQEYMRTRVKIPSRPPLYRLLAADIISTDNRMLHVARLANLQHLMRPAVDPHLPPLLIFTIMLPMYPATIFGSNDGSNQSLVYYFGLPPDFNPAEFENQIALGLLRRFVTNGREADGSPTRDRLKLIPRVVNVDEWAQKGPLSPAEHKLLTAYNDKPVLARPQHHFFTGPGYLEVDIDIHCYQFLARKALCAFFSRLAEVIWENAFVIQGNGPDELPEQVLAAVRMYRIDLLRSRPLRNFITQHAAAAASSATASHAPAAAADATEEAAGVPSESTGRGAQPSPQGAMALQPAIPEGSHET